MAWVPLPDLAQGLNLDTSPEEVAPGTATGGSNVRFRNGYAERRRGMANVYATPAVTPYHIGHYQVGTTRYVIYQGLAKTYVDSGSGSATDITNAGNTGGIDDRWSGGVLNGVWVQNNGVDVPQYWGGSGTLANLPGWPSGYKCGFLRPFKNFLVAGDITRGSPAVRERGTFLWSDVADPGTLPTSWDITDPTIAAGDQPLAETNGTLIDAMPLGDTLIIYKDDAIHFAQAIGSNDIFRFGRMPGNTGLLARGCMVQVPAGHVFLTPGYDVVLFNGQSEPQSILEGRFRNWLANGINQTCAQRAFLASSPATNEVLICFPYGSATSCNKALVWNWKDNTFGITDLSNVTYGSTGQVSLSNTEGWNADSGSWDSDTTTWGSTDYAPNAPRLILPRTAPALTMWDATTQDYGADFTGSVEYAGWSADAPESMKWVRAFRPRIDAASGATVYIKVGSAMAPDQSPTWGEPVAFTVGSDIEAHATCNAGRFLAFSLYASVPFRFRGAQADIVAQGRY